MATANDACIDNWTRGDIKAGITVVVNIRRLRSQVRSLPTVSYVQSYSTGISRQKLMFPPKTVSGPNEWTITMEGLVEKGTISVEGLYGDQRWSLMFDGCS